METIRLIEKDRKSKERICFHMFCTFADLELIKYVPLYEQFVNYVTKLRKDGIIELGSQGGNSNTRITKELL